MAPGRYDFTGNKNSPQTDLLALILGPMCEKNFVRYMNIRRGNFFAITTSPIAMVFAGVAILVIVYSVYNQSKINKRTAANAAKENA